MPLVSIIIPCYNVAPFMKKCLDTVCAQTLRDIQIICINDGSGDGTLDILKEYEAADERFVVIDQPNAGVAAARNETTNSLPFPSSLRTSISPPRAWTRCLTMAKPKPVPPVSRLRSR